ncbi:MAG: dihydroxy-acid dehydratase, partial [Betaproteobacteria bacterium]|nr:dihydroxy-acid dehydratase [Betaproteobacteria bacterium]
YRRAGGRAPDRDDPRVIKTLSAPFKEKAGIAILRGNLAPRGAVIKPSAATPALMVHTGRAVVFEDSDDFHKRIDDESLDVDENCILVLKNCGPKGYPGMAEVGNMPLPPKVLRKGITDMIELNVPERRMQLLISDEELKARLAKWVRPEPPLKSGYWKLYVDTVLQADEGCDLDFLVGKRGAFVPKDNH